MSTYCAPCLADLALVRDAVTSVGGTAACTAHAVLLTHPGDSPQRRLTRLGDLRTLAESKLTTASPEDAPALELLVQEYALAGAMDMSVPLKDLAGDRAPRPPKTRRNRPGRGDRPEGERGPRPEGDRPERGPRPEGERRPRHGRPSDGTASEEQATVPAAASDAAFGAGPGPAETAAPVAPPAETAAPADSSLPDDSSSRTEVAPVSDQPTTDS